MSRMNKMSNMNDINEKYMHENNHACNMTDKEFDSVMFEIFSNSNKEIASTKLWLLYNGDLDGCKQWLAYCKHVCKKTVDKNACLEIWNMHSFDFLNFEEHLPQFTKIYVENGVLTEKEVIFDTDERVFYEPKSWI